MHLTFLKDNQFYFYEKTPIEVFTLYLIHKFGQHLFIRNSQL
jgi:hypothetical protein